jgi:alpha-mannosidase
VDEYGLPTAPAQRFVSAGRLTVVHEGVCEYELIDIEGGAARTIALTVLRSTGMLSRLGMAYRPFPAGPMTAVEGLQMRGKRVSLRYAMAIDSEDPYSLADDVLLPLETVASLGGGTRPPSGTELTVDGAEVSALHRVAGTLELRVYNPRPDATTVSIPGRSGWLVDLRGYPKEPFEGSFELRPFGIATARLRAD